MSDSQRVWESLRPPETDAPGRVLIVDDNDLNTELLSQELEDQGFLVETAGSGEECLRLAQEWEPKVILLDVSMPGMDGIETCQRLKAAPGTQAIPVLFVTAFRDDELTTVRALEAGGNDFVSKPFSPPILRARIRTQLTIFRSQRSLRRLAMRDDLTDLFSRRFFMEAMRQLVAQRQREASESFAVVLVDIDYFKQVNDVHGHLVGDRLLQLVARTLERESRAGDIVARYGGEEFVVVAPDADTRHGLELAERLRQRVVQITEGDIPVTISAGVASWSGEQGPLGADPQAIAETVLRRADEALYDAKASGRNRVSHLPRRSSIERESRGRESTKGDG